MTHEKKVVIMRNGKKILKQNSLPSGIIIKLGCWVAFVALCTWFVMQMSLDYSTVLVGTLAYAGISIVLKLIRMVVNILLSLISFLLITALILFLIF